MGFLDKAKAAATDLAAKADTALASSGLGGPGGGFGLGGANVDTLFRDLGVLAYLEAAGRPVDTAERERVLAALREAEQRGAIPSFALRTTPPPAPGAYPPAPGAYPPPPGAHAAPGAHVPPPPGGPQGAPPATGSSTPPPAAPPAAPPPPPSWAAGGDTR
ncbi:hypothetical protein [Cellulomonas marina]|uniref:Uncharacterized protein n=1 Tax=Cellulomonas marina TaxID=988821 RepID=A0A1I1AH74_9CELL|nr:hypothetical protein [Cellulomonas marina]SFB37361.1 hypothetical protein SAMN05421867_11853 [Cellulomonas marina]